jgi:ribonuclease BN (tRNA processing enzyme)
MNGLSVLFLGSGDAFCAQGRHQAGYLVQASGTTFLLDCGATTLCSLKREGVDANLIDTIFISHLHGDHLSGVPFLFLEYIFMVSRQHLLRVAGPPGTRERLMTLYSAMFNDTANEPMPFPLKFIELMPQQQSRVGSITVHPFEVPHQENDVSLGLLIEVEGRRILYSGDTGWTEELVSRSQDTDLFICECSFFETRMRSHLDYPRLVENRHRFGTKRLILTHLGNEVLSRRNQLEIELAHDGLRIQI